MARGACGTELVKKTGGDPVYREGVRTDNGNYILDVYNLRHSLDPYRFRESMMDRWCSKKGIIRKTFCRCFMLATKRTPPQH